MSIEAGLERQLLQVEDFREDILSLRESAPYVVRMQEGTPPVRCESCGTNVSRVPEGPAADGPERRWKPAIWEPDCGRKHTLRRCQRMRDRNL